MPHDWQGGFNLTQTINNPTPATQINGKKNSQVSTLHGEYVANTTGATLASLDPKKQ